jgi:hypothetical protein
VTAGTNSPLSFVKPTILPGMDAAVFIDDLKLETDVGPADWVVQGVRDFEYDVGSLVPTTFAVYARLFHPAYVPVESPKIAGDGAQEVHCGDRYMWEKEVRWSEVAAANGRVAHRAMDWQAIIGSWELHHQPGVWDQEPEEGVATAAPGWRTRQDPPSSHLHEPKVLVCGLGRLRHSCRPGGRDP